jgi:hypothetical protein
VRAPAGELPGVVDQFLQREPDRAADRRPRQARRDRDVDEASGAEALQIGDDLRGDVAQVHPFELHLGARDPREREQIVNQLAHAARGVANPIEVAARLFVERRPGILDDRLAEAVDAAQRRAQVVRDRIAERLQLAVRIVERALDDLVAADFAGQQRVARGQEQDARDDRDGQAP